MEVKLDKKAISTPNFVKFLLGSQDKWISIKELSDEDLDELAKEYRFKLYEKREQLKGKNT